MKKILLALSFISVLSVFSWADSFSNGNTVIINQSSITVTSGYFTSLAIVSGTATDIESATINASGAVGTGALTTTGANRTTGVITAGSAAGIAITNATGNLLPAALAAGSLPVTVIVSSVAAGTNISAGTIKAVTYQWGTALFTVGVTTPAAADVINHSSFMDGSFVVWAATGSSTAWDYLRLSK